MDRQPVMVITGTSSGIGRGMAQFFLKKGYLVAGCSRGPSSLEIAGYQHNSVDISDEKQVIGWIRSVKRAYQKIDVVVCNAGAVTANLLFTLTTKDVLEPLLKTNINGTFYVCKEAAKAMMPQRAGAIITISSMAEALHEEGTSAYAASKSAIVEMTKVLAKEMAPTGITCNVIAPSIISTKAVEEMGEHVVARALDRLTIKRFLTIEEICNVISFLAAPESACITGQVIYMGLVK